MATRGKPDNAALLIIDMQNGVVANAWKRDAVIANCATMVKQAREWEVPVIWIQHEDEELARDSDEWQLVPELVPADDETRIYKKYSDSFADTNLSRVLEELGIGHLVISGAQTNACVRATTYRAAGEGFDVTLVGDAHTTEAINWEGVQLDPKPMIDDLNLTMRFLEWPNQHVTTQSTSEIFKN